MTEINTTGHALSDHARFPCRLAAIFADGRWELSFHPSTHDAAVCMASWQHPVECWSLTPADGGAR
jgi:hypothetical protein